MTLLTRGRGRHAAPPAHRSALAGTGLVARLALRRSRWFWLLWLLALGLMMPATVSAYHELMPDTQLGRGTLEALAANPTMRAMLGPPYDLGNAGGFAMWRVGTFVAAAAAMMAALGVIRATRAEEEAGRLELLRAGAIGRRAPLAGALLVAFGACLALALLVTAGLATTAPPLTGALAAGLGIGLTGAVWAAVGAVAAQLSESARTARFIAVGSLGLAYVVRALADGGPTDSLLAPLGWLSPVQWAALARPYADERWWVLLLPLVSTVLLAWLAFALEGRRDHGGGVRAARPGPAHGSAWLGGVEALVWRLERGAAIGWLLGMALFSLAIGSLAGTIDQVITDNEQIAQMFRRMGGGGDVLRDAFYGAMLSIVVALIALYGAAVLLRLRAEQEAGHIELLGSTATSRTRLFLARVVPAFLLATLVLVVTGACIALPQAISTGDVAVVPRIVGAALGLAPGIWLTLGLGAALLGLAPRFAPLIWVVLGWALFVTWVGALLNLPQVLLDATPFAALAALPVEPMNWTPWLIETGLAVALVAAGWWGWRRADIAAA
ncbi:ABC-2 type transport system permease protein [Kineosphaera limosa]|uniref:ABC transporter permease protein n=1 Tax=Kineosphaera limosa NBRC 100340 TaxID=1184609 RepID=K6W8A8_9MICO|nr:hypothetical protein [Kineosphaera limosa]NYE01045.1 ABC-2 type transport system permease protein [Kineosphaera limosa]GAB95430.1 hypothetical protein KILIM_019_00840 [Kineosphaera limosa NBRC 100340]